MKNRRIEYYLRNDILLDTPKEMFDVAKDPIKYKGVVFLGEEKEKYISGWLKDESFIEALNEELKEQLDIEGDNIINHGIVDPVLEKEKFNELVKQLY